MKAALLRKTDSLLGPLACALCSLAGRPATSTPRLEPIDKAELKHVVVIRPGGMGDMVVLIPVLRHLAEQLPQANFTLICEQRNADIIELAGLQARTLCYDTHPFQVLAALRNTPADLVIDTEQFHNFSAVLGYLSGAPNRIGFNINPRRNPLYTHLVPYQPDGAETAQFAALLEPLAFPSRPPSLPGLLSDTAAERPQDMPAAYAVVQAGAAHHYKHWPDAHYVEVAKALSERGLGIVLTGGSEDIPVANRIADMLRDRDGLPVIVTAGTRNIADSAAILRHASLYVGTDTGMAHLATAFGVAGVVIFGPSDPRKWSHGPRAQQVVSADLPCSPCFLFGYCKPCRDRPCMQQISPTEVITACATALA